MTRGLWFRLGTTLIIGAVFAITALASAAEDKPFAAIFWSAVGAVVGGFAPDIVGWLRSRWIHHDEQLTRADCIQKQDPDDSVAWLLHPAKEVVTFTGREEILAQLQQWCEDKSAAPVRLITAPGGNGKTRLARQLSHRMSEFAWQCEYIAPSEGSDVLSAVATKNAKGILCVVDYAETYDRATLAGLICSVASPRHRAHTRLLLLARTAGDWWSLLGQQETDQPGAVTLLRSLTVRASVIPLDAHVNEQTSLQLIKAAMHDFAKHLGRSLPQEVPLRQRPNRPPILLLHTEALALVLRGTDDPPKNMGESDVIEELLIHEESYWRRRALRLNLIPATSDEAILADQNAKLRRMVSIACLLGARDEIELDILVQQCPDLEPKATTMRWLQSLYPTVEETSASHTPALGTLQPDLLAEHLATNLIYQSTPKQLAELLSGISYNQALQALNVLARAALIDTSASAIVREAINANPSIMVKAAIEIAPQIPGVFTSVLLDLLHNTAFERDTLQEFLTTAQYPSLELNRVAAELAQQIVDLTLDDDLSEKARAMFDLSVHLAGAGKLIEALQVSEEALALRRELTALHGSGHLADLAMSMHNHAVLLRENGIHTAEALQVGSEAIAQFMELTHLRELEKLRDKTGFSRAHSPRKLASYVVDCATYMPHLIDSMSNHAVQLAEAGALTEALTTNADALAICRFLVSTDRTTYLFSLAALIHDRAIFLYKSGCIAEAASNSEEAVTLLRELANSNRDAHLPYLAKSLKSYADWQLQLNRHSHAIPVLREAIACYRELAKINCDAHLIDCAQSLRQLSHISLQAGYTRDVVGPLVDVLHLGTDDLPLDDETLKQLRMEALLAMSILSQAYLDDPEAVSADYFELTGEDIQDWLADFLKSDRNED
ncbi:tetratricopeptide repeat protein [Nonomuraea angiospora]|uniref:tetratricopeptide repeat protein n=1 Tax=Nonomuraea angiospora TaxID=46172 RepID=UPI003792A8C6